MGAWIEIVVCEDLVGLDHMSLLSWERGLKFAIDLEYQICAPVAPLVGAWIEIGIMLAIISYLLVAPLVGAWIEIGLL